MDILIVIPARYGSTRFPGKPLVKLGGKTLLARVVEQTRIAAQGHDNIRVLIATDDERIMQHAEDLGEAVVLTPASCPTGTDRTMKALRQLSEWPAFVLSVQGDVPLIPPNVIRQMITAFEENPHIEVATPVQRLSWDDLKRLRLSKMESPFSGTTVVMDEKKQAIWFSKQILPAIRNEAELKQEGRMSPVWRHIGLYGYRVDILEKFTHLEESRYEKLEGLEQLRLLENGIKIQCVPVDIPEGAMLSGIDSPEDLKRAEEILKKSS